MRKLFLLLLVFVFIVPVPAYAQDGGPTPVSQPLTAREVIELMGTPQENGIPNSYLTDTRYKCAELEVDEVVSPLLGLDFVVLGGVRELSWRYFDQQCHVDGDVGDLPSYQDGNRIYLDASVISAIARYTVAEAPELVPSGVTWLTVFKSIPAIRYEALAHASLVEVAPWEVGFEPEVSAYVWIQARNTTITRELQDESTWQLLPLVEHEMETYVILPSWHLVPIQVWCNNETLGEIAGGELTCAGQTPQEIWKVGEEQRYQPGIYYH